MRDGGDGRRSRGSGLTQPTHPWPPTPHRIWRPPREGRGKSKWERDGRSVAGWGGLRVMGEGAEWGKGRVGRVGDPPPMLPPALVPTPYLEAAKQNCSSGVMRTTDRPRICALLRRLTVSFGLNKLLNAPLHHKTLCASSDDLNCIKI